MEEAVALLFSSHRMLPFDHQAAKVYAPVGEQSAGQRFVYSVPDDQIAAITQVNDFAVAARDTLPFLAAGVRVTDPWENSLQ